MTDNFSKQEETKHGPSASFRPGQPVLPEFEGIDIKRYLSLFLSNWYWFFIALFISTSIAYGINRYSEKQFTASSSILIKDDQIGGGLIQAENLFPGGDIFRTQQNLKNEIGILKSFKLNYGVMDSLTEFQIAYTGVGRRGIVERLLYTDCPFIVLADSIDFQQLGENVHIEINSGGTYKIEIYGKYNITVDSVKFGERFQIIGDSVKFGEGFQIIEDSVKLGEILQQGRFNFVINLRDSAGFEFDDKNSNKYYFYFQGKEYLANTFRNKLIINPIEEGASMVDLFVTGPSAAQNADYLNMLMDLYIARGISEKNETVDKTISFIQEQLGTISISLDTASKELEKFRLNEKIIDLTAEGRIIKERLERNENDKILLDQQRKYFEYMLEYLQSREQVGDIISPSFFGISDPTLEKLIQEFSSLKMEREQLSMNISDNYPPLLLLDRKIEVAREALTENVRSSIDNITASIEEIDKRISVVEKEIMGLPKTEGQLVQYQRTYDLYNTVYTYLMEKKSEADIARASSVSNNRIIDYARATSAYQIRPRKSQNMILALFLGIIIPMLLIALIDYLNNKIIDRRDVEKGTTVPIIGYISHNDLNYELPVVSRPGSPLAESFRSIRTALGFYIGNNYHPVISITSTVSAEGKTFVAVNLAAITAMLGKKVLLVGLDLRKPRIHKVFEIDNSLGLSTYLSGNCTYEEIIQETGVKGLFYAPSGPVPPNPAELIESERMKLFLDMARAEFEIVIIDTPPVAIVTDALLLANQADVNLFVVRQRYSSKNTLSLIEEMSQHRRLKNISIIINDISLSGYYGYGLRYGDTMGYGYSYGNNYYGTSNYSRYGYSDKESGYYSE